MKKALKDKILKEMAAFEAWVNDDFMTDKCENPASWFACSRKEEDAWQLAPYEHPWTVGAWEAWKKFKDLPRSPEFDEDAE